MKERTYFVLTSLIFGVMGAVQVTRAALRLPVSIGSSSLPVWPSWLAALLALALSGWGLRLATRERP